MNTTNILLHYNDNEQELINSYKGMTDYQKVLEKLLQDDLISIEEIPTFNTDGRPNVKIQFMKEACMRAQMSTCGRTQVGCVITKDGRQITNGFNGAPSESRHCIDHETCIFDSNGSCFYSIHAEQNAIAYCAKKGIALEGAEIFCTHLPCLACAKSIKASGINKVYIKEIYRITDGAIFLKISDVEMILLREKVNESKLNRKPYII